MAKITKHPRKSGAVTVKKDGKIVGNIGSGKIKTPTAQKVSAPRKEVDIKQILHVSSLKIIQQKFAALSGEELNYEQALTLWNITAGQETIERLNILGNYINNIPVEAQNKILTEIEDNDEENNEVTIILEGKTSDIISKVLDMLARTKNFRWQLALAGNEQISPEILDVLADSVDGKDSYILNMIADNPNVTADTLTKIFTTKPSEDLMCGLAVCENTPQNVFRELAKSEFIGVRTRVAQNPKVSPKILSFLSKDEHPDVRGSVAMNPNVLPRTFIRLVKDPALKERGWSFNKPWIRQHINIPQSLWDKVMKENGHN